MSAIVSFDIDIKSILNNELSHFQNPRFWPHHINAVISVSLPKAAETGRKSFKSNIIQQGYSRLEAPKSIGKLTKYGRRFLNLRAYHDKCMKISWFWIWYLSTKRLVLLIRHIILNILKLFHSFKWYSWI